MEKSGKEIEEDDSGAATIPENGTRQNSPDSPMATIVFQPLSRNPLEIANILPSWIEGSHKHISSQWGNTFSSLGRTLIESFFRN